MSKVLTTTAAIICLSLGPAPTANCYDYHAWSRPTAHDDASYPATRVNKRYWHGELGTLEGKLHHFEIAPDWAAKPRMPIASDLR
jgi:hypothetical protein